MTEHQQQLKVGLIGRDISASKTPAMHMAEGRAHGIDYQYDLFDVATAPYRDMTLQQIVDKAMADGYAGLNITHPFKQEVLTLLNASSATVQRLGAANTVVFTSGAIVGHNTDCSGYLTAFKQRMSDVPKQRVVLIGAGGAGLAVAMALLDAGVERLEVFDQSPTKAQALKTRLTRDDDFGKIHLLADLPALYANPPDGIVNATPMGMTNYPGVAVEIESLPPRVWVSDIVYFPIQTELLRRARQHGCRVMNGSAMAVGQAVEAFRLFTGQQPDAARMAQSFADMLASSSSD